MKHVTLFKSGVNSETNPDIFETTAEEKAAVNLFFSGIDPEKEAISNAIANYHNSQGDLITIYENYIDSGSIDYYYTAIDPYCGR